MTTTPSTLPESLARCAVFVAAYFGTLFTSLEHLGEKVAEAFDVRRGLTASALSEVVHPLAAAVLAEHPVVGAGFVATPGALADRDLFLAWWQGEDRTLLAERGVPLGHHVFDYTRHEWFQVPLATGEHHVMGPYVDYVCTDEYVLTATTPVVVDGRMVGVAGADTRLETFEQLLADPLRGAGDVVLVNGHERCVVAADPLLRSGQRIDSTAYTSVQELPGLPFRVLGGATTRLT